MFNELRVNYQRVRDDRDGDTEFPALSIELGLGAGGGLFRVGRERSSTANELDQDIIEITDDFTMQLGAHTVTLGTHNEIFDFRNLFIQNSFGFYTFTNVENFEAGLAQAYAYSLLEHRRSAAGGRLRRAPVQPVRRRPMEGAARR